MPNGTPAFSPFWTSPSTPGTQAPVYGRTLETQFQSLGATGAGPEPVYHTADPSWAGWGDVVTSNVQLNPAQWSGAPAGWAGGSLADASEEEIITYVTSPQGGGLGGFIGDPIGTAAAVPPWVWIAGGGALAVALALKFWPKKKGNK